MDIDIIRKSKNLAKALDEETLNSISAQVIAGYEYDDSTRAEWKDLNEKAMEMAKQTVQSKDHPWPDASNVKFPLITKASIEFAARTYPEIVKNGNIVKAQVIGRDPNQIKQYKADNVSMFMSYQLLNICEEWEEGLDISLHTLSIVGTIFKKTYYDPIKKRPMSIMCNPDKVIVDYNIQSLKSARRITHIMHVYKNDIVEQMRAGNYREIDLDEISSDSAVDTTNDPMIELLEQHCYLDLDDDGYSEPYIVTLHKESKEVLSIMPRFASVSKNSEGKVLSITPEHWFTDYHFIRNHDGGFYSLGFGILLMPLNAAINTIVNQLIDSGTLNNLQSGFIGRGIRIKGGNIRPTMGEWKILDSAPGVDLQRNIFPLPTKDPSMVLFNMLNLLIQAGKELTSSGEVLNGQAPSPNTPASSWLNSVDNALKILTAINKRIYKSLTSELKKIFYINQQHLTNEEYRKVLDDPNADKKQDFDAGSIDIIPVVDPNISSATQRMAKIQAMMAIPVPNQAVMLKLYLQALEVEPTIIEALMTPPEGQSPPAEEILKMAQAKNQEAQAAKVMQDLQMSANELLIKSRNLDILQQDMLNRADEGAARILKMQQDMQNDKTKLAIMAQDKAFKGQMKSDDQAVKHELGTAELAHKITQDNNKNALKAHEINVKAIVAEHKTNMEAAAKADEIEASKKEVKSDD